MDLKIDRGLFRLDLTDYHAVLGLPITADANKVRKRYLQITRKLHPDSPKIKKKGKEEQKLASNILSKLVNPAYEQLHKDQSRRSEYQLVLSQTGKRLAEEGKFPIKSDIAKTIAKAGANIDNAYRKAIEVLAKEQYDEIEQILDKIAQMSELNVVYLIRKQGQGIKRATSKTTGRPSSGKQTKSSSGSGSSAQKSSGSTKSSEPAPRSPIEASMRRAKEYVEKANFAKAVLELRDALKLAPNDGSCHGLLGWAYLQQKQIGMARVHLKKALQLNPKDEFGLKGKALLEKIAPSPQKTSPKGSTPKKASAKAKSSGKSEDSGFFSGFFGGKKK